MKVCKNRTKMKLTSVCTTKIKNLAIYCIKKVKKMGDTLRESSMIAWRLKALLSSLSFVLANGMGGKVRHVPRDKDS